MPAGQAQKEAFINEALARIDILLHPAFVFEASTPPADPEAGSTYLVAQNATDDWSERTGALAAWTGSAWIFVSPRSGMIARDLSSGQTLNYDGEWRRTAAPPEPEGGHTIDAECRASLLALLDTLRSLGIFSS
ncbi:DUF2793 domain-containing protein [Qipengyuania spongiae]|uniref:DUF2793 domain-containing protein n=1 Tax=Qipengyuania spongiae TaxID=2909673 RepID=A0ABY5T484_9SPHN|nr:DUF2793 domain-containing protein [Qipengyuania spongiae]UVI40131.1 DUF2793 domain-containing protein [Qipengyuania spongiae]